MQVYDPIYGAFTISDRLARLAQLPEVRRLSQVRLLNTVSPSLATLGELRRYSHTLGVLFLGLRVDLSDYSHEEREAFYASILLHDIGTPPFAHLFEYLLRERSSGKWTHERMIRNVLWACHAPENSAHQIFAGQMVRLRKTLDQLRIDHRLVEDIVTQRNPLSRLLFGSLDIDNLDNVARMTWALGGGASEIPMELSSLFKVRHDVESLLCPKRAKPLVERWLAERKRAYDILVFDRETVAAQAVLSTAMDEMLTSGQLSEDDWSLTDEGLLDRLSQSSAVKSWFGRDFFSMLPTTVFIVHVRGFPPSCNDRRAVREVVERAVSAEFGEGKSYAYLFRDKGSFEKAVELHDPETTVNWIVGNNSASTVIYGFVRGSGGRVATGRCRAVAKNVIDRLGIASSEIQSLRVGSEVASNAQQEFDFSTKVC